MAGEIYTVLDYLRKKVQAKNEEKYLELIGYLEKHRDEIIDYQLRKKAGKMIGVALLKRLRSNHWTPSEEKGMSWRETGSLSLGILRVAELNKQWEQLWFPAEAANDSMSLQWVSNL
ncbi:MAG: hypothetical protein IPL99_08240 [Candidatus Competibacteraceae bacterium]|nr:hypothetical protein [Candidatus Competibacteraceae bacterium]